MSIPINSDAAALALLQEALTNHRDGNFSAALLQYKLFLSRDTENLSAWEGYSSLLLELGRLENCIDACQRALAINPESASAISNIKSVIQKSIIADIKLKGSGETLRFIDRLLDFQIIGGNSELKYQFSYTKLLFGDFEPGWRLYESRLDCERFEHQRLSAIPMWDGKPYRGKTLFIYGEQGHGDIIMMMRYFERVKALGGTLLAYAPIALVDVARTCPGPDYVFGEGGAIRCDMRFPVMSLPWLFKAGIDTTPPRIPYLSLPEHVPNKAQIAYRLNKATHTKKYGLVWAGNPDHSRDSERSIPPGLLRPLGEVEGASWFCLQHGVSDITPFPGAIPLGGLFETFSDTAFALSQLDLVVTVDTSVAHLAGAMGVPVCLLVTFLPDFRWLLWRSDSPWYPSMKIYRQPEPGDWPAVIQQVAADLEQFNFEKS